MLTVALYARVSSERQVQGNTVASQLSAIENQIRADGHKLLDKYKFVDDGYSGSNLVRPALEKLRDKIAEHKIDIIYIHSPDRLSRKYSYQMVLLEEFQKAGAEVKFLNHNINDSPESHLLLQMQGMIAEYEHAKITERCRRGKIYSANKGYVNVMSRAPYGYRYITKYMGNGQAFFEIHEEEAEIIRKMFFWIGRERISIREICDRLNAMSILTQTGKTLWNKAVVFRMLKNTAYKGLAAFGKRKVGPKLPSVRPPKHSCEQPRYNASIYPTDKKHWIYIPVPNIVSEDLFDEVQEQLAENRKQLRHIGTKYLLQGLVVCQCCYYAYCGTSKRKEHGEIGYCRGYYYCIGTGPSRFGGNRVCNNKSIYADVLETTVWEEVKYLLKNPNRILEEYQNRILETERLLHNQDYHFLKKREDKLKRGISRLIDSYAQEYISQEEFEPRIKAMKQNLKTLEEQKKKIFDQQNLQQKLTSIIVNIEEFSSRVESSLDKPDFLTKRDIIRALVKRIEISLKNVNIVFRVKETPYPTKYKEKAYDKFQQRYTSSNYGNTNCSSNLVARQARFTGSHA